MAKRIAKVIVDRDLCIGAGSCVVLADQSFELDNEGKAFMKPSETGPFANTDEEILEAAKSCPVLAITVFDEDGTQVYP